MEMLCASCKSYIQKEGASCPLCGETVAVAGPCQELVRHGLRGIGKYQLSFCHLIAGITLAVFLYFSFQPH